ncbi:MAG: restriction endonuclease subunit S [Syntrophaceae bacterium]|nr:restriction endonuclease subunit S [Syntrophaceae bacterium]
MSPESLLKHFHRIAEDPDAIPRLRRFILDLAVRGKLVEQDPNDESAAELLKRIETEKAGLIQMGLYRQQDTPSSNTEEVPFDIPTGWQWTQMAKIGVVNPRCKADDTTDVSFIPMSLITVEYGNPSGHEIRPWVEIKKGFTHFAEGDVGLAKITPCFENGKSTVFRNLTGGLGAGTTELHVLRPIDVSPDYVLIFLKSPHFIGGGIPKMTGTAGQKRVPKEYFSYSPFPLPPLAEQHRIVAKVGELMALCDELEAEQTKRERRRDRLVAATLHGINNGDASPEPGAHPSFKESARFYFRHLPRFTTRPEHIQQLRQTILSLAVHGKLVQQNKHDETAEELINNILFSKKGLVNKKTSKKSNLVNSVCTDNTNFDIPKQWTWTKLGTIYDVRDGTHDTPKYVNNGYPLITSKNLYSGKLSFYDIKFISEQDYLKINQRSAVDKGDILFAMIGSIGNPVIVDTDRPFSIKNVALFKYFNRDLSNPGFLKLFLQFASNQMRKVATGGLQAFVSLAFLRNYPCPLPPLAEQSRIVAKVAELMDVCDELEVGLEAKATTQRQFLEASLLESLL